MSERYEPGPTGDYGADGIAREGMAERYATALWRDNPTAFWLHPEGPLADSAPSEYFVPRPPEKDTTHFRSDLAIYAGGVTYLSAYVNQQNAASAYANQMAAFHNSGYNSLFGGLFGTRF